MKQILFDRTSWPDIEGSIDMIFGGLGAGKTYAATADMVRQLQNGALVYSTWKVDFKGLDQRKNPWLLLLAMFGIRYKFYSFPAQNFHYVPLTDPDFMKKFRESTDCIWYVDEAYAVIDSYVKNKMSLSDRFSIYGTRHFNRRLILVAQRPSSIHVAARAMVNRFYRCERPLPFLQKLLHLTIFVKTEYQDMIDENVDLDKPLSTKIYFGKKSIFKAYNSKYLRGSVNGPDLAQIDVYSTSPIGVVGYIISSLFRRRSGALAPLQPPFKPVPSKKLIVSDISKLL
jgi:hypothetical protein